MADEAIAVKEAGTFDADKAIAGDIFKTTDGKVFKVVPVEPSELPEPEFWACVYADIDGRKWSRFFNSQAEHDAFISGNPGYVSIALQRLN